MKLVEVDMMRDDACWTVAVQMEFPSQEEAAEFVAIVLSNEDALVAQSAPSSNEKAEEKPAPEEKPVRRRTSKARKKEEPEAPKVDATPEVPPPSAPDPEPSKEAAAAPAELVTATSFRQVIEWMLKNGHTTAEDIIAQCEAHKAQVAAIGRLRGDLTERVERALSLVSIPAG